MVVSSCFARRFQDEERNGYPLLARAEVRILFF
jgi:hypothetical protein